VLEELAAAGSHLSKRDFYKILGKHYSTAMAVNQAIKDMRKEGLIQDSIRLTALGSAKLNQAKDEESCS
jgi:predicted transcriptional regulator